MESIPEIIETNDSAQAQYDAAVTEWREKHYARMYAIIADIEEINLALLDSTGGKRNSGHLETAIAHIRKVAKGED